MKRFIAILLTALLTSCGVGNYSITSGQADQAYISFTSSAKLPIQVTIDGNTYAVNSIKKKAYKARNMRHTDRNSIIVSPGSHDVTVMYDNQKIFEKKIFISTAEHRIINL